MIKCYYCYYYFITYDDDDDDLNGGYMIVKTQWENIQKW